MYWYLAFLIISFCASTTNAQRRALVYYPLTSTEIPESVSENPLSSSINSIQTGREELIAYHNRGDTGPGGSFRRGYHKTTTPPYFKETVLKGDSANTAKPHHGPPLKSDEADRNAHDLGSRNDDRFKGPEPETRQVSTDNRGAGDTIVLKDKRSTGVELSSSSTVRPDTLKLGSETGRSSQKNGGQESMDNNKGTASREQDRRTNVQESRRHTTTPSSSSSAKYNVSVRDGGERHREEVSEKNLDDRPSRERRPTPAPENLRGHRTATRSTSDKGQILTNPSTPRIPTGQRYDRTEQPSGSSNSHDRKALDRPLDSRDNFRSVDDKKKELEGESDRGDKIYQAENEGRNKAREDRTDSVDPNKPTHALGEKERPPEAPRSSDVYIDGFKVGDRSVVNGKVGSDTEKPSGRGEGKIYPERPYPRDDEERSPSHHARDADRGYTRRHRDRDRYDERSYDERPLKDRLTHRGQERNATYDSQDRTAIRSSRPRDGNYDEEYRDDGYSSRDVVKDSDGISKDSTRGGRRPYTRTEDDIEDKYGGDGTRNYRDYSDDRQYRDESVSVDRDSSRRYRDEDNRRYKDGDSRTYDDDYEDADRYRDDYSRRYEKEGESRRYRDDVTRRYTSSGSRRYDEQETGRQTEYDRPARRYKDDDEYKYNNTRRYRDNYDGYRDDNRRSSGESVSSHRYDERGGTGYSRYDDEEYKGSRSYSSRDSDRKYSRGNDEDTSRQRDATRKYVTDDATRYREDDEDRYRNDTRVYSGRDVYDQDSKRIFDEGGSSTYIGTRTYHERPETNTRREYDDVNRHNVSRTIGGDGSYRNYSYTEDDYYNNRTSTGYVDRYDGSDRSRRTDDDYSSYATSDGDSHKYISMSNDERRRDRVYVDIPVSRRRTDLDDARRETGRGYDEDRQHGRDRADSYDERTYRDRNADEYIRSSRDRNYDTRVYRDSDDEADNRNYRVRGDVDDRYRGDDTIRDRLIDDEIKAARPAGRRSRDKGYTDRRYEDGYRDKGSEGTYSYGEEDERYRYASSEDKKPEYRDTETRSRGTQRFRDDYDSSYDRDSNSPRNADERRRGVRKSNRREDRFIGDSADFDDKAPDRLPSKPDTSSRGDTKTEFPDLRGDESLIKGERSNPYDDESRRDGRRSHPRDTQPDDVPPKARISVDRPDSLDKGDFEKGRRTSFYNIDDKVDSDREERAKGSTDDRRLPRTEGSEELTYPRNEKDRGSGHDTRDSRQSERSNVRANTESRTYSNRRESSDTSRHKNIDEMPVNRMSSDMLPISDDRGHSDRAEDVIKAAVSQSNTETQRRYTTSSNNRGSRRQLPSVREPEVDRSPRRDESEDSLPENRGRYRYTKSRGDRGDFDRQTDERPFTSRDEYNPRGGKSSRSLDADRGDTLKGDYGSPGSGTPTRNKQDRISTDPGHQDKEEYLPSSRDNVPLRNGKPVEDSPDHRDYDRHEKVLRDRDNVGRDERGMYENSEYHRSSSQEEMNFGGENTARDHSSGETHVNKENDPILSLVPQTASSGRGQGSTISRSATPIPHFQDKEFMSRNTSSKNISDKISGASIYREKRFHYDDRLSANNTTRGLGSVNDEMSRRPLTTKEVIDAAYRHSDEPEKQREIIYPVYVPGSGNLTSPDVIRPSERRGITTPTKKKKKK